VRSAGRIVSEDARHINFEFQGKFLNGAQVDFPAELLPIFALSLTFNTLLSELYIKEYANMEMIN
jgi:hypothetical protein